MTTQALTVNGSRAVALPDDFDVFRLAQAFAKSGYFSDAADEAKALVKILYGRELGIPPVQSMMGIHVIKGKASPSAGLIATVIKRSGKYDFRVVAHDDSTCDLEFFEVAHDGKRVSAGHSTFTKKDADTCGATNGPNKDTWRAYPRNMLFARAVSNGAKWFAADVFGGPVYTPEELDVLVDGETGEVIAEAAPRSTTGRREDTGKRGKASAKTETVEGEVLPAANPVVVTQLTVNAIQQRAGAKGFNLDAMVDLISNRYQAATVWELSPDQAKDLYRYLGTLPDEAAITDESDDDLPGAE